MRTIDKLNSTRIQNDFASKLYGGAPTVTVKVTITSKDGRAINAGDYVGKTYTDPNAGTQTTLDECENTSSTTVVCTGTGTTTN